LGKSPKTRKTTPLHAKPDRVVLSLVERGGSLRSIYLDGKTVREFLMPKVLHDDSRLLTDGAQHLHRYLAEFDFRYNNRSKLGIEDAERANNALKAIGGKRLTYRRPDAAQ